MKEPGVPTVDAFLNLKGRMLRTLIQWGMPLPLSRIAKEMGSNYVTVRKHLRYLEEAGLIISVDYGKRKLYRVNTANERISVFRTFIEAWESNHNGNDYQEYMNRTPKWMGVPKSKKE